MTEPFTIPKAGIFIYISTGIGMKIPKNMKRPKTQEMPTNHAASNMSGQIEISQMSRPT